jgi:hypothetical protein
MAAVIPQFLALVQRPRLRALNRTRNSSFAQWCCYMLPNSFVGQPILAAAAFQAAFFSLRAALAKGTGGGGFSTLSPADVRGAVAGG